MSLYNLIEIGRRALSTQQTLLSTTGQNIANADTEGYSRREATIKPTYPLTFPVGQIGTGVTVTEIKRVRNELIDRTLQHEQPMLGLYEEQNEALQHIEGILNEPSDTGLNATLYHFFNSFRGLVDDPENPGVRATVRGSAQALTGTFNRIDRQFQELRQQLQDNASAKTDMINELTDQIAALNRSISRSEYPGSEASEERDRRDLAVEELSKLITITAAEDDSGALNISAGGQMLVIQDQSATLQLRTSRYGATTVTHVVDAATEKILSTTGGAVHGILEMKDEIVVDYMQRLDHIATTLVQEVNTVHMAGFGTDGVSGRVFFDQATIGAGNIAVDAGIEADIQTIAASLDGASGDNQNAIALTQIENALVAENDAVTLAGSFHRLVGDVAVRNRTASAAAETQQLIVSKLENERLAVSGVSLDEEATNLIVQQRAYQAATRLIRTVDELTVSLLGMVQ